jgi:hypothetical protein
MYSVKETCSQNRATSELGGQRKHGKEECLNCTEFAKQENGVYQWKMVY